MFTAITIFIIVSILGGHYIHRKRQFRIEQALAIEENPYLYKAAPGKEKDLMIPIVLLQLDTLEELLRSNDSLSNDRKKQFEVYKNSLKMLIEGHSIEKISDK
jgi:hypothetical protein